MKYTKESASNTNSGLCLSSTLAAVATMSCHNEQLGLRHAAAGHGSTPTSLTEHTDTTTKLARKRRAELLDASKRTYSVARGRDGNIACNAAPATPAGMQAAVCSGGLMEHILRLEPQNPKRVHAGGS